MLRWRGIQVDKDRIGHMKYCHGHGGLLFTIVTEFDASFVILFVQVVDDATSCNQVVLQYQLEKQHIDKVPTIAIRVLDDAVIPVPAKTTC